MRSRPAFWQGGTGGQSGQAESYDQYQTFFHGKRLLSMHGKRKGSFVPSLPFSLRENSVVLKEGFLTVCLRMCYKMVTCPQLPVFLLNRGENLRENLTIHAAFSIIKPISHKNEEGKEVHTPSSQETERSVEAPVEDVEGSSQSFGCEPLCKSVSVRRPPCVKGLSAGRKDTA